MARVVTPRARVLTKMAMYIPQGKSAYPEGMGTHIEGKATYPDGMGTYLNGRGTYPEGTDVRSLQVSHTATVI